MNKKTLRTRRWYIYIWLHFVTIALVNAWFLYWRNEKWLDSNAKTMPLRTFQAAVACGLWAANKGIRGRPSLQSLFTSIPNKVLKIQSSPSSEIRLDGVHLPDWADRRQRCRQCSVLQMTQTCVFIFSSKKPIFWRGCRRKADEGMRVVGRRKCRDESEGRISYLGC